jgi:hypothetical protein
MRYSLPSFFTQSMSVWVDDDLGTRKKVMFWPDVHDFVF